MHERKGIIVGLPVRNEEKTLKNSLNSICDAILETKEASIRLVICINGCADASEAIAWEFKRTNRQIKCDVISSDEGLVNAQRVIVKKYAADTYVFPDADGAIEKNSIKLLLEELKNNPRLIVAYARTKPLENKNNHSIFHKIGLLYDSQKLLMPRRYFHGRLFATRDWYIPEEKDIIKQARKNTRASLLLKYCVNTSLFSADDIFMSSYVMDKYGLSSIKQVDGAICYSWPVGTLKDWWQTYRRRNIEMEKMYRWYPEYNYLKPHLNRHTSWSRWIKASIPDKINWLIFIFMKKAFRCLLFMELVLLHFPSYKPGEQWKVTLSTKIDE